MHRVDGPGTYDSLPPIRQGVNTPGYFGPGDPASGRMSTRVPYEWANDVQENICKVIEEAGLTLDKGDTSQLWEAILKTIGVKAPLATKDRPGLVQVGSGLTITAKGVLSAIAQTFERYDVGQYYWFEDEAGRPGLFSCQGGVVQNFSVKYPKAAAYFSTPHGQKRLVTQAQYNALHVATWHTNADGTKVGWEGIGGVNKFVWNKSTDTLTLPDLAGMTPEQVGYGSLGVGGVRPDQIRNITGNVVAVEVFRKPTGAFFQDGALEDAGGGNAYQRPLIMMDVSRVVPTGPRNHGPRWISDARVYLGQPAL